MQCLLEKEIKISKQNRTARILSLVFLFFGVIPLLLAFPIEEAPGEINQNSIPSARAGVRESQSELLGRANATSNDENAQTDRAPEGSTLPAENIEQSSSSSSACNIIENIQNQNSLLPLAESGNASRSAAATANVARFGPYSLTHPTDIPQQTALGLDAHQYAAAVTAASLHENSSSDAAPLHFEKMQQVVGVPSQFVRNWVQADYYDDLINRERIFNGIIDFIQKRNNSSMSPEAVDELKTDLADRALEAQGRSILPDDEAAPSIKSAGDKPHPSENPSSSVVLLGPEINDVATDDEAVRHDASPQVTFTKGLLNALQESRLADLAPEFLVTDVVKEKKEVQEKYKEAHNNLRVLSPELANAMVEEDVPKTEEEDLAFQTKWKGLIQNSTSGDLERAHQLDLCITRLYGLKAALNVLDSAVAHRNRFLEALKTNTDSRKNGFYHEQIDNINKTIQNLQSAAASILQTTERIITNRSRWKEAVHTGHSDGIDTLFNNANMRAQKSIRLNTQYAEAIRAGDPQAARNLAQRAQSHTREAEFVYSGIDAAVHRHEAEVANNEALSLRWHNASQAFFLAANAVGAGNQRDADLYAQAATCYRNSAEVMASNNDTITIKWENAASVFRSDPLATEEDNQPLADFYTQEVTDFARTILPINMFQRLQSQCETMLSQNEALLAHVEIQIALIRVRNSDAN